MQIYISAFFDLYFFTHLFLDNLKVMLIIFTQQ